MRAWIVKSFSQNGAQFAKTPIHSDDLVNWTYRQTEALHFSRRVDVNNFADAYALHHDTSAIEVEIDND